MNSSYGFETTAAKVADDLSSQIKGKVILVTGVSPKGLGASFVEYVVPHEPKLVVLAGRTIPKLKETEKLVKSLAPNVGTRLLELDLTSLKQVRDAANKVNAYHESIDVLVNNAGVMARPYELTEDGIESQLAANHVGHFLFTNLIIEKILSSPIGGRVVNVSSDGYRLSPIRFYDVNFDNGKTYDEWVSYGQSKTANLLFAKSLATKLSRRGLIALSLHPGAIGETSLATHGPDFERLSKTFEKIKADRGQGHEQGWWKGFPFKSFAQGAATHVRAAFDPDLKSHNGGYLGDGNVLPPTLIRCWGRDDVEAEMLWQKSEELVGQEFPY